MPDEYGKRIVKGYLSRNPYIYKGPDGQKRAKLTIATNIGKNEKKRVIWTYINVYGEIQVFQCENMKKGDAVLAELGEPFVQFWQNHDAENNKYCLDENGYPKYSIIHHCHCIYRLDWKSRSEMYASEKDAEPKDEDYGPVYGRGIPQEDRCE